MGRRVVMTFLPRCRECAGCATDGLEPRVPGSAANGAVTLLSGDVRENRAVSSAAAAARSRCRTTPRIRLTCGCDGMVRLESGCREDVVERINWVMTDGPEHVAPQHVSANIGARRSPIVESPQSTRLPIGSDGDFQPPGIRFIDEFDGQSLDSFTPRSRNAVQLVLVHLDDLAHGKAVSEFVHAVIDLVKADGR